MICRYAKSGHFSQKPSNQSATCCCTIMLPILTLRYSNLELWSCGLSFICIANLGYSSCQNNCFNGCFLYVWHKSKSIKTTQGLPSLCLSVWPSCIRMNYTVQRWGHLSCYIGMQYVRTWHQVTTYWNITISNSHSIVKNQDTTSKFQVVQRPGLELVGMLMFKTISKDP